MCGRYAFTSPVTAMREVFELGDPLPNLRPQYNIAPSQAVPIVLEGASGRVMGHVRWGLVPSWMRAFPKDRPQINARSETISEKPMFRSAYQSRRCLVPANGFYEWRRGRVKDNHPFLIHAQNMAVFAMAGIWETWTAPDGTKVHSMAIVTKDAEASIEAIHHRMPVVLRPENYRLWLAKDGAAGLEAVMKETGQVDLQYHPISTNINKASNDGNDLLTPVDDPAMAGSVIAASQTTKPVGAAQQYSLF